MKLKDTGLTVQDIKACISMMKKELHTSIFMQELQ